MVPVRGTLTPKKIESLLAEFENDVSLFRCRLSDEEDKDEEDSDDKGTTRLET